VSESAQGSCAQAGLRFSAKARMPSWPSSPAKNRDDRSYISANCAARVRGRSRRSISLVAARAPGAPSFSISA
jgi:hypothetical protein